MHEYKSQYVTRLLNDLKKEMGKWAFGIKKRTKIYQGICRTKNGKMCSYMKGVPYYDEHDEAIASGKKAFTKIKDVFTVEVFQSGLARPVARFT